MGLLVDGQWQDKWYDTKDTGGRFERSRSQFRSWITADGKSGASGEGGFKAESGRYHLYVSYACPVAETVHMDHIRQHYFRSHPTINPYGIVPIGPVLDFSAPHDRARLGKREIRGT